MRQRFVVLACLVCVGLASVAWTTAPPAWERLGTRKVSFSVDRDAIPVTVREGTFRGIQLKVRKAGVTFRDVKVYYANGSVEDIKIRRHIPAGGETRVIDLDGRNRVITKVVFWYNTKPGRARRATVELWGMH